MQARKGQAKCEDAYRAAYVLNNKEMNCSEVAGGNEVECGFGMLQFKPGYWHDGLNMTPVPVAAATATGHVSHVFAFRAGEQVGRDTRLVRLESSLPRRCSCAPLDCLLASRSPAAASGRLAEPRRAQAGRRSS